MTTDPIQIDLSDIYNDLFTKEIETYRRFVTVFIDQIFERHFIRSGLIKDKSYAQLSNPDFHPSLTAFHFTRKMFEYYLDKGDLKINDKGYLEQIQPIKDEDPGDESLNAFLAKHPEKQNFFGILRKIRDVAEQVLFQGEDALLTLANDNFREAMKLWEDLMINAQVKQPCHQLIIRALKEKTKQNPETVVFEGGAGVGSVLRDGLNDPSFVEVLSRIKKYHFTDVSLSLIKMGRENLRQQLPADIFERFVFKVANLDQLFLNGAAYTRESEVDLIILEHVLYDVIDLKKTLELFYRVLKPGGFLVFTMAFRSEPKHFFPFEYLQSTFQSYNKAKLEELYRQQPGYLSLKEWEYSLKRAGFEQYKVYPEGKDQICWPYGGILAIPSK